MSRNQETKPLTAEDLKVYQERTDAARIEQARRNAERAAAQQSQPADATKKPEVGSNG